MNKDAYVIIPVYNEETVIDEVLTGIKRQFSNIICVNDGSSDESLKVIQKHGVKVVSHKINLGQGAALKTGIDYVLQETDAKYLITFDADGQHDVNDAGRMLATIRKDSNLDIVLGSRFLGLAQGMSLARRVLLKAAIKFTNITTGIKLTDTHVGLRVFNRRFAKNLNLRCKGMAHASEFVYKIADKDFKYKEIPVTITYSDYSKAKGQSNLNALSILKELYFTKN